MVTFEELVEKMARDIYNWKPRNKPFELLPVEFQRQYTKRSRVILATILEAMSEPNEAMVTAAMNALDTPFYADIERGYRAMLAASPLVEEERR